MTLQQIETFVLQLVGYDRYSALSVDTNSEKMEDFANLHTCVNLAREEIKMNAKIPALARFGTAVAVTSGNAQYSMPTDFDVPIALYYYPNGSTTASELSQAYIENLPSEVPVTIGSATPSSGTPSQYFIVGTSSDLIQVYLYPTPDTSGFILPLYKPVLTTLTTATDQDTIMRKYPKAVINFATAFAWQLIKKDPAQHDKYYTLGMADCDKINLREIQADSTYRDVPDSLTRQRRAGRLSR